MSDVEQVMVIPAHKDFSFNGYRPVPRQFAVKLLAKEPIWLPRPEAETDELHKQIIPYAVLMSEVKGETFFFVYRRGMKQGEDRLHKKLSIGIGGHVNPCDMDTVGCNTAWEIAQAALDRELTEEVRCNAAELPIFRGLVNDNSNAVGRVHLGLVYTVKVSVPFVAPLEANMDMFGWWRLEELVERADDLETWSTLLVREGLIKSMK